VFFDHNANGAWDDREPVLPGVNLAINGIKTVSGEGGEYLLAGYPAGRVEISISAPGFRFLTNGQAGLQPLSKPLQVEGKSSMQLDIGLVQGILTLPFQCCPRFTRPVHLGLIGMFDLDRRYGFIRSYDPQRVKPLQMSQPSPPWVYDQHDGIDFAIPVGTEVVASAPGVVKHIGFEYYGVGTYIILYHPITNDQTLYGHLSQVMVKLEQTVRRGQVIGKSGNTGFSTEPHLHLRYATWDIVPVPIDPFRNLHDPASVSHWTVDNAPQYP